MDIVDKVKACKNNRELRKLASQCLKEAKDLSKSINEKTHYLGYDLEINPKPRFDETINEFYCPCSLIDRWVGYIPKNIKYCYGYSSFNNRDPLNKDDYSNALLCNDGWYYYIDDEKYIYEYFKYLKDTDIEDEFDLLLSIQNFIFKKFGEENYLTYDNRDISERRDAMQNLFMKESIFFSHEPVKEHSLKAFYDSNAGMCTEIGLLAQNILSTLGFISVWVLDTDHVYNMLIKQDDKGEKEYYILDFSNGIFCYDIGYNSYEFQPYFHKIEGADSTFISDFLDGKEKLEIPEYEKIKMAKKQIIVPLGYNRTYGKKIFDMAESEEDKTVLAKKRREK